MLEELEERLGCTWYIYLILWIFYNCVYTILYMQACLAEDARHSLAFAHERLAQLQHAALWLLKGEATKTVIIED